MPYIAQGDYSTEFRDLEPSAMTKAQLLEEHNACRAESQALRKRMLEVHLALTAIEHVEDEARRNPNRSLDQGVGL